MSRILNLSSNNTAQNFQTPSLRSVTMLSALLLLALGITLPQRSVYAQNTSAAKPTEDSPRPKRLGGTPTVCTNGKPCELQELVVMISRMTAKRFIFSEKLKGQKIYIHGLRPDEYMSPSEAYQLFLSTLQSMGISVSQVGRYHKLIDAKDATKMPIPTCIEGDEDCILYSERMITALIRPENLAAQEIQSVIKALISKDASITVFGPSNTLIVSEYAPNLTRIRKIIRSLDQEGGADELRVVQIRYATASEVAGKLNEIFEVNPKKNGSKRGGRSNKNNNDDDPDEVRISQIIADDRTNQLIIKADRRSFNAIRRILDAIDIDITDEGNETVHVYYVENTNAEELAGTLSNLAQSSGRKNQRAGRRANNNGNDEETPTASLFSENVRITADAGMNALIIMGSGRDYKSVIRLVKKLDRPRKQVYVEAAIMEVTIEDGTDFGLGWHAPMQFAEGDLPAGAEGYGVVQSLNGDVAQSTLANVNNPTSLLGVLGGSVVGIVGNALEIPIGTDDDGNTQTLDVPSFGLVLQWLETFSQTNILSTPHILTTDNEEATIEVGQRIAFLAGGVPSQNLGQLIGGGADSSNLAGVAALSGAFNQQIRREDVSLKLTLTPHVNQSGKVRLEIDQQIEDIIQGRSVNGQPSTSKRVAKTTVVVDDQQTVVLGGLMRERQGKSESKVPILGDIPILGAFFKQKRSTSEKVNLLLVLTPYIIEDAGDFQSIYERKLQEYDNFAAAYYGHLESYRAHVDFRKKVGPLARLGSQVQFEMNKIENGGPGHNEVLIDSTETEQDSPSSGSSPSDEPSTESSPQNAVSPVPQSSTTEDDRTSDGQP